MTAKQLAIQDIKDDLKAQGKCFLAFHSELTPIMNKLVTRQIRRQKQLQSPSHKTRG